MNEHEKKWAKINAERKATAISNRKRLTAETVAAIDAVIQAADSIVSDTSESILYGHLNISLDELVKLSANVEKLRDAFIPERR